MFIKVCIKCYNEFWVESIKIILLINTFSMNIIAKSTCLFIESAREFWVGGIFDWVVVVVPKNKS